jgi:hypothetical protein
MQIDLSFQMTARQMGMTALVNGFEVASTLDARPTSARVDLRPYLVEGENSLHVSTEKLPPREGDDEDPWLECGFFTTQADREGHFGNVLAGAEVDPAWTRLSQHAPTKVLAHAFHLPAQKVRFAFLQSKPWGNDQRREAQSLVDLVRAAIATKNLKELTALYAARISEVALAQERERDEVELDFIENWTDLMTDGDLSVAKDDVLFEPAFDWRVLHVRGFQGRSPVQVRTSQGTHGLGMSLARINDTLRIIR